ncbi:hypothetical protein M2408_005137 [Sphingobacterium sp. BIGb0165]|nr:hypothetical protein [Sphingobacterium sp. BIGb0165]
MLFVSSNKYAFLGFKSTKKHPWKIPWVLALTKYT